MGEVPGFCHAEMRACPAVKPADVAAFRAHMPFLHTIGLSSQVCDQSSSWTSYAQHCYSLPRL